MEREDCASAHAPASSHAATLRSYYPLGTDARHQLDTQLAQMKRAELEQRQQQESSKDCVFRPCINHDRGDSGAETQQHAGTSSGSVFARLREQARLREERRQRREREKLAQEEQSRQAGFQPVINKKTPFADRLKQLEGVPVEERLLFYGRAVAQTAQMRREEKAREEREAAQVVHARAHHTDPNERRQAQLAFDERNARLLLRRELSKQIAERQAAESFTFQPKISATSAAIEEATRRHQQRGRSAPPAAMEERPSASSTRIKAVAYEDIFLSRSGSRGDATGSASNAGHADRGTLLYERALHNQKRKEAERERELLREQMERSNFNRPRTNPISEEWIQRGQHQKLFEQDFVRRQALYDAARQEELDAIAKKQSEKEEESRRSFCASSRVTPAKLREQVDRLYYHPLQEELEPGGKLAQKRKTILATECPFKPQLSSGTEHVLKRMAAKREADVVARLAMSPATSPRRGQEKQKSPSASALSPSLRRELYEATPEKVKGESKGPVNAPPKRWDSSPARPTLSGGEYLPTQPGTSPSRALGSTDLNSFFERQEKLLRSREEKARLLRQRELVEEMARCTFRPQIVRQEISPVADAGTTPTEERVSGVQQYLQRQALAQRLRDEKEERVRNMGRARRDAARQRTATGNTIVSPFHLETDRRHETEREREAGTRQDTSLFALTTAERQRLLEAEYPRAYTDMAAEETCASGTFSGDEEDEQQQDEEWASDDDTSSSFEVHASEPDPAEPAAGHVSRARPLTSSSGGETCSPRNERAQRSQRAAPPQHTPTFAFSSLKQRDSTNGGPKTDRKDSSRSVSFVGVLSSPLKPQRGAHTFSDPHDASSLLGKLREAQRR